MRIKQLLTKTLLAAAGLCMGAMNASGYTRTLTADLKVAGYTAKQLYDFQNNNPEVLPTSGDLRYRSGGTWGLHNFGSGSRSGEATIPVATGDILIIEVYNTNSDTPSVTINKGTENSTLSTSTGYTVFDITSDATAVTFTANRYTGIMAALVMEKDESVETADYTINYKYEGNTIASDTGTEVVGGVVNAASSKTVDGVKYIVDGGQTTSLTITSGTNTLDLTVSKAAQYTHIAQAVDAKNNVLNANIASVTAYEGDAAVLTWSKYIQDGEGNWYVAANNTFRKKVTEGGTTNVTYNTSDIAYFFEFDGIYATRADNESNGSAQGASAEVIVPADGVYIITANCYGSAANRTATIKVGETEIVGATTIGIYAPGTDLISDAIALQKDDVITVTTSDSKSGIDYVILKKASFSPAVEDYATFSSEFALDFTSATGVKAYYASASDGSTVTMTKVTGAVAAGTGLLLQKVDDEISIPTAATGTDLSATNLLKAGTGAAVKTEGTTHRYVLAGEGDATSFYELAASADAVVIPEGKAYLEVANAGARLKISFSDDETTGIANVEKTSAVAEGIYNLNGQRVVAPQKGLYIVNGKKVIKK